MAKRQCCTYNFDNFDKVPRKVIRKTNRKNEIINVFDNSNEGGDKTKFVLSPFPFTVVVDIATVFKLTEMSSTYKSMLTSKTMEGLSHMSINILLLIAKFLMLISHKPKL